MIQQSGGVRALKTKAEGIEAITEKHLSSSQEIRPNKLDPKFKQPDQTTKNIAEAAAAKEEEDRGMLCLHYLYSIGAIARGSYIVPTDNPLLASKAVKSEPMSIQQTIQSVQLLTRNAIPRDPSRDDV